jgi:SET domain-containing protein
MPNAQRGVFANVALPMGEVIERCPIIAIPPPEIVDIEKSILLHYCYFFGKKKDQALLALGFGSLYNHSYTPNATYTIKLKEQLIIFTALKDIAKNEEIVVNYNQGNDNCAPLWFEECV